MQRTLVLFVAKINKIAAFEQNININQSECILINFSRQGLVIINGLSLSAVYSLLIFFAKFYIAVDTAAYDDSLLSKHLMFQQL